MFNITTEASEWFLAYLARSVANALSLTDVAYQHGYAKGYAIAQSLHYEDKQLDRYFALIDTVAKQRAQQLLDSEFSK